MNLELNGIVYDKLFIKTPITRQAIIKDTQNSGWNLKGDYRRDIVGTYYNFTLNISMLKSETEQYDNFYKAITEPREYHIINLPFGQGFKKFKVYITAVNDNLVKIGNVHHWENLNIQCLGAEVEYRL